MTAGLDLDSYLRRIHWQGSLACDHATLARLVGAHMRHIPFENLDVLLGRGIRLELPAVQDKLVRDRRGGYCFEHGTLFAAVLEATGFAVARHTARVILFAPRSEAPRGHMLLSVSLPEGEFVVDPGFGGLAPRAPLPLRDGVAVSVGHEQHWMARDGEEWLLRARTPEKVRDCWVTALDRDNAIDFEVGNHFTATHPRSAMVNRLMLRALTDDGRVAVMNREVTVHEGDAVRTFRLDDRRALRELLRRHFGFDLPEIEGLHVPSIAEWR